MTNTLLLIMFCLGCGFLGSFSVELYFNRRFGKSTAGELVCSCLIALAGPITLLAAIIFLAINERWKYLFKVK